MDLLNRDIFPLADVSQENLASLCETLWGWKPCPQWLQGHSCQMSCCCQRATKLEPFFNHYRNITACYLPDVVGDSHPALRTHDDLFDIMSLIRFNADKPRAQLISEYFGMRALQAGKEPPRPDQDRAFNLAARVLVMVQCSAENQCDGLLEAGNQPLTWHSGKSLSGFIASIFPKREHPALNASDDVAISGRVQLDSVTAKRLKKVGGLDIIGTNDLRNHLFLDEKRGILSVFHFTSVLKEHLAASAVDTKGHGEDPVSCKAAPRYAEQISPILGGKEN